LTVGLDPRERISDLYMGPLGSLRGVLKGLHGPGVKVLFGYHTLRRDLIHALRPDSSTTSSMAFAVAADNLRRAVFGYRKAEWDNTYSWKLKVA
jgi:hypothetical protein